MAKATKAMKSPKVKAIEISLKAAIQLLNALAEAGASGFGVKKGAPPARVQAKIDRIPSNDEVIDAASGLTDEEDRELMDAILEAFDADKPVKVVEDSDEAEGDAPEDETEESEEIEEEEAEVKVKAKNGGKGKPAKGKPAKEADEDEKPKGMKAKAKRAPLSGKGRDMFGSRIGTKRNLIHEALSKTPATFSELVKLAGLTSSSCQMHMDALANAGKIKKSDKGYSLIGKK